MTRYVYISIHYLAWCVKVPVGKKEEGERDRGRTKDKGRRTNGKQGDKEIRGQRAGATGR